jgi:hypothetical protein
MLMLHCISHYSGWIAIAIEGTPRFEFLGLEQTALQQ